MNPPDLHIDFALSFFSSTAQVSGGLVGLVFVALTFKPALLGAAGDLGMRKVATQTFADFLAVLMISLMAQCSVYAGTLVVTLGVVGSLGFQSAARSIFAVWRAKPGQLPRRPIVQRPVTSLIGNLAILAASGTQLLRLQRIDSFWSLVFAGVIVLILSGTRSAWLLVTHDTG